ncbi:hypothetical protein Ltuc_1426 [Legionella tucsonensis]|uniref:Uncharacterized protein n=1 Tax=Legionella tucsonensis TaxID=40335 RepID=A0A0W0ZWP9_9GAMM|nr:hypothetical protein Ltuc_1426 [Legionella tucsonensis]
MKNMNFINFSCIIIGVSCRAAVMAALSPRFTMGMQSSLSVLASNPHNLFAFVEYA